MQSKLNLKAVIAVATSVAGIYLLGILLGLRPEWIFALGGLSMGATVWMALRILKDIYSTDKTFDDYFYEDRPDIRRV